MNLILFDDPSIRLNLLPFTYTRPVSGMRVGILTIQEKWEKVLGRKASCQTEKYLSEKFPPLFTDDNLQINGAVCPDKELIEFIRSLKKGECIAQGTLMIAGRSEKIESDIKKYKRIEYPNPITLIDQVWKIFVANGAQIRIDFELITRHRDSAILEDPHTRMYAPENIFIEEGADVKAAVLNAENGPIYLDKNSQVQEGTVIRGPFSLGKNSIVNMGGKMRGDVSVGPHCKVGGEISTAVIFGYSNKAHDGFLGSSVLGEWCNLGADTNTSNLKNNYDEVKLWSYPKKGFQKTGLTFCGLMMGDHSKCGINTMFNTGTVVGVSANIYGSGYPRNFVPSFAWGGTGGYSTFQLDKVYQTASMAMGRREVTLSEADKKILAHVFEETGSERLWGK